MIIEDSVFYLIIALIPSILLGTILYFKRGKSGKRQVKQTVSNAQIDAVKMMRETIEEYKRELKRLNGQNAQLKRKMDELNGLEHESEEKRTLNQYSSEEILQLVSTLGIKNVNPQQITTIFKNPMVQDYLSDKTVDDVQEIFSFIQPFLKGSGQPQNGATQISNDEATWA